MLGQSMSTVDAMRMAMAGMMLGAMLLGVGLSSCAGEEGPPITPGPVPSGTPVFASEEEALAAAEEAYGRYLDVFNRGAKAGWTDLSELETVLTDEALADQRTSALEFAAAELSQVGNLTFDSVVLQQWEPSPTGALVIVYLCLDVSKVDVLDAHGDSVVSPDRPPRQALEVGFAGSDARLKIARSDTWPGTSFC